MLYSTKIQKYRASVEVGRSRAGIISSLEEDSMVEHYQDPTYSQVFTLSYEDESGIATIEFVRNGARKESISMKRDEVPHIIAFLTAAYEDSKNGI